MAGGPIGAGEYMCVCMFGQKCILNYIHIYIHMYILVYISICTCKCIYT